MAENLLQVGLRAAVVKYDVKRFVNTGPDSSSGKCSRLEHVEMKCRALNMVACTLCVGNHLTREHKCNIVGCKAKVGQNCNHNV